MRRFVWPTAIVLAMALAVGLFAGRGGVSGRDQSGVGGGDSGVAEPVPPMGAPEYSGDGAVTGGKDLALDLGGIQTGPSIIRFGDLSLVVGVGDFDDAVEEASAVAVRYGGFVISSSISGGDRRSGMLTLRVRSADFDRAMADLMDLGDVESQSVSGEDVGIQVVDLQARLDSWKAQREVLLRLLAQSRTVSDTLKVQVELQNVQSNIEQLSAQLTYLQDQVSLATISVGMREPGATGGIDEGPRFGDVWRVALRAFLGVIFAMIVGLGYLIPIAVVLGAILWVVRYRRGRKG